MNRDVRIFCNIGMQCIQERASRLTLNFRWGQHLPMTQNRLPELLWWFDTWFLGKNGLFLKSVQEAFYVQNADVTKVEVLEGLAVTLGMDASQFRQTFQDPQTKSVVWEEFDQARQLGVSGFPALLGRQGKSVRMLMHGYQDFESLTPSVEQFLQKEV